MALAAPRLHWNRPAMLLKPACLALILLSASTVAPQRSAIADLVGAYAESIQNGRGSVDLSVTDLDAARQALGRIDPGSIPVDPAFSAAEARERQRRLMTAFALELAAAGSHRHAAAAARLVEWACPYVRSHSPINDFDRAWQLAALAALEGGIDSTVLHLHLDHVQAGFGEDPRYALARGVAEEQFGAPAEVLTRSASAANLARARDALARAEGERYRALDRAIARFRDAAKLPPVAAEATLRMGHVQHRLSRHDAALETWSAIETLKPDPSILYLAHLFRGLAHESYGRTDAARAAYLAALKISPKAHSANMRLAALSFVRGGDDPSPSIEAVLRDNDPRRDPWWSYYAADWRFWYPRIQRVRELATTR
jgi:tetratricopeptide (TPR) repeat protein